MDLRGIDTHCHPQFEEYDSDRRGVILRAAEAGVGMICVGTDLNSSQMGVDLAREYGHVWAAVGVHPNDAAQHTYDDAAYESMLSDPRVVAVGEIGLDYHRTAPELRMRQEELFIWQYRLSQRHDLPCIIHCRDAHQRMIQLLVELSADQPNSVNRAADQGTTGVIHSFNDKLSVALSYISSGWYIGLNGIVTFSDEYDELVRGLPMDRILLETDAPYLSPVPYRGKRNEPTRIMEIAAHLARIRGIETSKVLEGTTENAYKCFTRIAR